MIEKFSITFQPLSRDYGDIIERATFSDLSISVGDWWATELEDLHAKTVRKTARVSAYLLAKWFASNWWRLRWESERNDFDWRMSHKVGAAGGGYLWPDLSFSSEGDTIHICSYAFPSLSKDPIRYLNSFDFFVSASDFENEVDSFLDAVIARLISEGIKGDELQDLWQEVLEERRTPEIARWRKLEAIIGFDPGEGPESAIRELEELGSKYGVNAVEEMAAESREKSINDIQTLWGVPYDTAPQLSIPNVEEIQDRLIAEVEPAHLPWQKAEEAARIVRDVYSLDFGPVKTQTLSDIFGISKQNLEEYSGVEGPVNAGYRNGNVNSIKAFLRSPIESNRRFALLRLVGDHLTVSEDDRLLPATNASTQRQKFQRAFAQEFLCPYAELVDFIGSREELSDEKIDDVAYHFNVSPLLVKTTLVNKGDLERSRLLN